MSDFSPVLFICFSSGHQSSHVPLARLFKKKFRKNAYHFSEKDVFVTTSLANARAMSRDRY
jgi:hypothetical protein